MHGRSYIFRIQSACDDKAQAVSADQSLSLMPIKGLAAAGPRIDQNGIHAPMMLAEKSQGLFKRSLKRIIQRIVQCIGQNCLDNSDPASTDSSRKEAGYKSRRFLTM